MLPKVSIIILNWNGWQDTIECLESLYQIDYPNYNVIVVDNGSEDESISKIKDYCNGKIKVESNFFEYSNKNKPIKVYEYSKEEIEREKREYNKIDDYPSDRKMILIKNDKNYGFAEGNNIAMRFVMDNLDSDYVLLLNNDTVVDKNFLGELVETAQSDNKIGVVGPKIYYYDETNVIQSFGMKINYLTGKIRHICAGKKEDYQFHNPTNPEAITGSAMLLNKKVLNSVEGFDENFFTYVEEIDLCLRILKSGYTISLSPDSKIYHKVRGSKCGKVTEDLIFYRTRNYILMIRKNFSIEFIFISSLLYCLRFSIEVFSLIVKFKNRKLFLGFLRGIKESVIYIIKS